MEQGSVVGAGRRRARRAAWTRPSSSAATPTLRRRYARTPLKEKAWVNIQYLVSMLRRLDIEARNVKAAKNDVVVNTQLNTLFGIDNKNMRG